MNVYIVLDVYESPPYGVFSTWEKASQYIDDMLDRYEKTLGTRAMDTDYWIEEMTVDALVGTQINKGGY